MSYAVVVRVSLPDVQPEYGMPMLINEIVPRAKALPGFQKGTWCSKEDEGVGFIVFDTVENALSAREAVKPPPAGPTLRSIDVYEVNAEAC
jgi:hypothetical protein